jgi:hypothetical protein
MCRGVNQNNDKLYEHRSASMITVRKEKVLRIKDKKEILSMRVFIFYGSRYVLNPM